MSVIEAVGIGPQTENSKQMSKFHCELETDFFILDIIRHRIGIKPLS